MVVAPFLKSAMTSEHTSPIKAFEAMAAGRPLLISDTDASREIVEDGRTGLVVPPGNVEAWARRLSGSLSTERCRWRSPAPPSRRRPSTPGRGGPSASRISWGRSRESEHPRRLPRRERSHHRPCVHEDPRRRRDRVLLAPPLRGLRPGPGFHQRVRALLPSESAGPARLQGNVPGPPRAEDRPAHQLRAHRVGGCVVALLPPHSRPGDERCSDRTRGRFLPRLHRGGGLWLVVPRHPRLPHRLPDPQAIPGRHRGPLSHRGPFRLVRDPGLLLHDRGSRLRPRSLDLRGLAPVLSLASGPREGRGLRLGPHGTVRRPRHADPRTGRPVPASPPASTSASDWSRAT